MRLLAMGLCLLAAVVLVGCDPLTGGAGIWTAPASLYPMYGSDKETVADATLLGEWRHDEDASDVTKYFFREDDKVGGYVMGIVSGGSQSTWRMRLVPSEGQTFLDVAPLESRVGGNADASEARLGLHLVLRLRKEGARLHLDYLNPDWYMRLLEQKQFPLKIERLGDNMPVVTSPPEEIRAFYTKAAADPKAFAEVAVLHRPQGAKTR